MTIYGIWEREGYTIYEKDHDYDLHRLEFVQHLDSHTDVVIANLVPSDLDDQAEIIAQLEAGADPIEEGWEDGAGSMIGLIDYLERGDQV